MEEVYKPCEFNKQYQISNFGNLKHRFCNGKEVMIKGSLINKHKKYNCVYRYVQIQREGKRLNYMFHRLVAIAFIPNDNDDFKLVDHIDRNHLNNHVSNLRWCDNKINSRNASTYHNEVLETDKKKRNLILYKNLGDRNVAAKKYYCETCDKAFRRRVGLNKHNETNKHKKNLNCENENIA
jgi:hypothetical protein